MSARWDEHVFVVLAYGDSPFLGGCLRSLASQTLASRVVIATSTPSEYIARLARDADAEVVVNTNRRGIASDWNFALQATEARFVTLAHQDDIYFPRFAECTQALFSEHPDGALAFTEYSQITDNEAKVRSRISAVKHLLSLAFLGRARRVTGWRLRAFLSFGNPLPCSSVTFDRARLPDFRFSSDLASNLDWEAWWRLHRQRAIFLHAPERLIGRRHNELTETSRLITSGRRQNEDRLMFERIWGLFVGRAIAWLYRASY